MRRVERAGKAALRAYVALVCVAFVAVAVPVGLTLEGVCRGIELLAGRRGRRTGSPKEVR